MELYKQIEKEAETVLSEFQASGLSLVVTGKTSLRIKGEATPQQIEQLRKRKAQLINQLSPKCSNGNLWFCPLGCESRNAE
jgi:hypothetical protein